MTVHLRCPACAFVWHAATIVDGAWWAAGMTPAVIAKQCHCPACEARPPMTVVPPQAELFEEAS